VRAVSLSRALEARFAGMTADIESNAVPDARRRSILLIRWTKVERRGRAPNTAPGQRPIVRHPLNVLHKI